MVSPRSDYLCYANGTFQRRDHIRVGINDLVFLRGYGAFDFMRTYNGLPFRLYDYLLRFNRSVRGLNLQLPITRTELASIVKQLLKKNRIGPLQNGRVQDVGIRLLLTGGYSLDSYLPAVKPNLFILLEDLPIYPVGWSMKGIKLILHSHRREMAKVKTTNYLTAIRLAGERKKNNAQDTLYCSDGQVLETTRNNFFLFHGDVLVTAKDNVLDGITRSVVLSLARKIFKVEVRDVSVKELRTCTEAFITGTTRGITPVVKIGSIKIGNGKPGKNTDTLIQRLNNKINKECR